METKRRTDGALISGEVVSSSGTTPFLTSLIVGSQRTMSQWTGWPLVRYARESYRRRGLPLPWIYDHWDWGASFITEKSEVFSDLSDHSLSARKGTSLPFYTYSHKGPALLGEHSVPAHYDDAGLSNAEQELWTQGAAAIRRSRPNKPALDLPVLIGELRKDGIPTLIGSLAARSKSLRDLFRASGKEYLNVQFGWAPLVRDLITLVQLIPDSRKRLEQYERDIEKLVRRRYHFPDQISTDGLRSYAATSTQYDQMAGTPWGSVPQDHISFSPAGQECDQVNRTTVKTWFSGGFRFYHRSVPQALQELSLLEEKANLLLGTRLDPEVLYNLAPWTWLADWFINFGDVVSNATALLSDDLVMQYGYLMRTTQLETVVTYPQGLWYRRPTGALSSVWTQSNLGPYSQTSSRVIKQRGKASPFGFGLTSSDFTSEQQAILAALGMSRV